MEKIMFSENSKKIMKLMKNSPESLNNLMKQYYEIQKREM